VMQLGDSAVDTARQTKVVRVYNELAHRVSLSTRRALDRMRCGCAGVEMRAGMMDKAANAAPPVVGG
jgi:hypothetical protein